MSFDKIKLFETVLNIHQRGDAELTTSERSLIEAETRDLLSAASRKQAMMAPEGFDMLLQSLKGIENADDAFEMVKKFMDEKGILDKGMDSDPLSDLKPPMDKSPSLDLPKVPGPMDVDLDLDKDEDKGLGGILDKKQPDEKKEEVKEDKKDFPFKSEDKDKKEEDKKEDLDKDKILAKVSELEKKAEEESEDKEEDKKEEDKEEKKEDSKEDKNESPKMEVKDPKTASKVKLRITSSRNLLASYDGKPLFHAVPNTETKADASALKRLANKVYGWIVYEGAKSAADKCGAKLFAGVDDDVTTVFDDAMTPPADSSPIDEGETVIEEIQDSPENHVTEKADFDTQEVPDKVTAGVEDGAEFVTEETPDSKPSEVLEGEETVHQESLAAPTNDSRDDADVDYKMAQLEDSYKKLYESRLAKKLKEATDQFTEKFVTCLQIASRRMLLNHDEHPYKAATLDILTDNTITFEDGSEFVGLYENDAKELTEHIAASGHENLVEHILERTASLMVKSDEYIADLVSDLDNLSVKPVEVAAKKQASISDHSEDLKKAASEGNFVLNTENVGIPVTDSLSNNEGGVRAAIGGTLLSKRANVLQEIKGCKSDYQDKE